MYKVRRTKVKLKKKSDFLKLQFVMVMLFYAKAVRTRTVKSTRVGTRPLSSAFNSITFQLCHFFFLSYLTILCFNLYTSKLRYLWSQEQRLQNTGVTVL